MIAMNGKVYEQAEQFSVNDIEVLIGVMDLDEVRAARGGNKSRGMQSAIQPVFPHIEADIDVCIETGLPLS